MILVSLASLALGAALATNTPAPAVATSSVAAIPTAVHAAPVQPSHRSDMLVTERSNQSSDEEAIQQQLQLRVLMPALSGDA
jgi:hypothetical protein